MSMVSVVFELAVAFVLVLVALLCWRLDRRLTALKTGQDGVRQTVVELAEATQRAQASVRELRALSDDAGRDLENKIATARALADELSLLAGRERDARPPREARDVDTSRTPRGRRAREAFGAPAGPEAAEMLDRLKGVR